MEESIAPKYILTAHQQLAYDKLVKFASSNDSYFGLCGYAGCGKSVLLSQFLNVELASKHWIQFLATAPTNKAVAVIAKFLGIGCMTIYSALNLVMKQDEDQLVISHHDNFNKYARLQEMVASSRCVIIAIDESSMNNSSLVDYIEETVSIFGNSIKYVFVGDPAQLPPVGEEKSRCWGLPEQHNRAMLKEVIRYDNALLNLATRVRLDLVNRQYGTDVFADNDGREGVWVTKDRAKFQAHIAAKFKDDPENNKIIAWRNKVVNHYNTIVRQSLGHVDEFVVGETISIGEPVEIGGTIVATTEEEVIIESIRNESISNDLGQSFPVLELGVRTKNPTPSTRFEFFNLKVALDPNSITDELNRLSRIAKKAPPHEKKYKWGAFWSMKKQINLVKPFYSLTSHRSQGSTFTSIWVDLSDIRSNQKKDEMMSCFYTTITRATTRIFVLV